MRSQFITAELRHWSVARYNNNNAWLYNGTNGTLNNNNLYNRYASRPLDYDTGDSNLSCFYLFLSDIYDAYKAARKTKRGKSSQMEFELNLSIYLVGISIDVWNMEYTPSESICFMLDFPKTREVIAAWFGDRIVQTWYCVKLEPYLESDMYDPQSYSCRKGKGGLHAVLDFKEHIRKSTLNYILDDVWIVKRDIRSCFMSVDTAILEEKMVDFICSVICEDEKLRNMLCWLTRIIYRSLPQEHCLIKTNPLAWLSFPKEKSSFGKTIGLAIGNRSSQQAVLFLTTFILQKLRDRGYTHFSHYTDDTAIVIKDKKQWRIDELEMEQEIKDELGWEWHQKKKYMQHYSKGVDFLGYKIRGDRILPSDRVSHNFLWKIECAVEKSRTHKWYATSCKESMMQTVNSYLGFFKWCDANMLREKGMKMLIESPFSKMYNFNKGNKVTIRKNKTRQAYFKWLNKTRKIQARKIKETIINN